MVLKSVQYSKMQVNASGELVIGLDDDVGRAAIGEINHGCTFVSSSLIGDERELFHQYSRHADGDEYQC